MCGLTDQEKEFLRVNGYLILHQLIPKEHVSILQKAIDKLFKQEGARAGDVRSSSLRQKLIASAQKGNLLAKTKLYIHDKILFRLVKIIVQLIRKKIPYSYYFTLIPSFYWPHRNPFKNELKSMLLNAFQQGEENVDRLCNLINKSEEFDVCITHPKVLHALDLLIGKNQYKLSSLNYRAPRKNCWTQPIHQDWLWSVKGEDCFSSNTLWLLDDITLENGPTRVVPGSHKKIFKPLTEMENSQGPHPDEIYLTATAGSVIILDGHIWHGGTKNISGERRGLIQSYFVHKAHMAQQYQQDLVVPVTKKRLSKEALELIGVIE